MSQTLIFFTKKERNTRERERESERERMKKISNSMLMKSVRLKIKGGLLRFKIAS